ncbi:unnamed protein product [Mytilus edulis]|uniref:WSC domain-containing protein n=1 Tax=Mytilus edulis TaxID=6550 RepID=A0A8S3TUX7_MYTED|nr:unnamed protein product [Mytilus edulis]
MTEQHKSQLKPEMIADSSNYIGCFFNDNDVIFSAYPGHANRPEMENSRCILYCKGKGYKYAGTEDEDLCYCGTNSFFNDTKIDDRPSSYCDLHCKGDSTQFCGGGYCIISVYETGFHSLNIQDTFYRAFAKDYKLTTQTRRVIRISSVSHCARHCLSTTSCRAFETCMDTAECRLIFDYETLCDGIQHEVGYVIYMLQ